MLDIHHVTAGFGVSDPVIADASVTIANGQRLLICGAAGSGKSTLLNIAAGIIPRLVPSPLFSGSVSLHGRPMAQFSKDDLYTAVSIVSQNVEDQLWDLSVEDLIAFPLENRGVDRNLIRARLQALLGEMELDALRGRRVLTLSGGERRMVAIAAALAVAPGLLVLDEPTTGLDPSARLRLVRILNKLASEIPALLVSEQDPASIEDTIDSVMLLAGGRLSPVTEAGEILRLETPWLEAGILPPHRRRSPRKTPPPGRTLLTISGLRTRLARPDGRPVLQDVAFDIRAGEILALIGRNGAGKTTLFQSILGLAKTVSGSIAIGGEPAQDWTAAKRARSIAYLPQNMRRILFNMTVLEEVVFSITAATGTAKDAAAKAKAIATLGKYGLAALADSSPVALSVRQQALLGLACADAAGASIAILDEPLLARDVHGRRMLDLFLDTMLSSGRSVMLISHDLELVDDVASRLLILEEGRITFDGRPDEAWASRAFGVLGWPTPHGIPAGEAA
ncbi:ABC transporter ATP-binding protein [Labrys monachus]|uniref:Energy-coupling factor transport system ATP-binding protein n=1 Tax=Labrys monachus TaxID=217067 RepID=A0ABU0FHT8_9HYPH|nr:ATP-binding cassette domain-containing protein [Labrys monachus]MDQ0394174.1 energy-coupling factor transport system ATP-binding protein [Labrys monachus]